MEHYRRRPTFQLQARIEYYSVMGIAKISVGCPKSWPRLPRFCVLNNGLVCIRINTGNGPSPRTIPRRSATAEGDASFTITSLSSNIHATSKWNAPEGNVATLAATLISGGPRLSWTARRCREVHEGKSRVGIAHNTQVVPGVSHATTEVYRYTVRYMFEVPEFGRGAVDACPGKGYIGALRVDVRTYVEVQPPTKVPRLITQGRKANIDGSFPMAAPSPQPASAFCTSPETGWCLHRIVSVME